MVEINVPEEVMNRIVLDTAMTHFEEEDLIRLVEIYTKIFSFETIVSKHLEGNLRLELEEELYARRMGIKKLYGLNEEVEYVGLHFYFPIGCRVSQKDGESLRISMLPFPKHYQWDYLYDIKHDLNNQEQLITYCNLKRMLPYRDPCFDLYIILYNEPSVSIRLLENCIEIRGDNMSLYQVYVKNEPKTNVNFPEYNVRLYLPEDILQIAALNLYDIFKTAAKRFLSVPSLFTKNKEAEFPSLKYG